MSDIFAMDVGHLRAMSKTSTRLLARRFALVVGPSLEVAQSLL
jgi:hypothetical protein